MKKWLVLTVKQKFIFDQFSPMIYGRLLHEYEQQITDGKMFVELKDWDERAKGLIIVEMEGTEDEIKNWTKKTLGERIFMATGMKPFFEVTITDA
jgi:hypothetical protein